MNGSDHSNPPPRSPFARRRRSTSGSPAPRSFFQRSMEDPDEPQAGFEAGWQDITAELLQAGGKPQITRRLAWEWSLVFESRNLPYRLERSTLGRRFLAPAAAAAQLEREIGAYEQENRDSHRPAPVPVQENTAFTVGLVLLLGLFHAVSQNQWRLFGYDAARSPVPWVDQGACDCFSILIHDAWWRSITALTLHADAAHLLGNMGIGLLVLIPLCRELGSGPGWFVTLAAGGLGNLLNCQLQGPGHLSVGASTAVFGAVGVLSGLRALRDKHVDKRSMLLPLGAGLTLLAFLGMGGEDPTIDVGAHIFGFAAGLGLGAAAGWLVRRYGPPSAGLSRGLGALAAALLLLAWGIALG